jgi:hypothetical protein
MNSIDLIYALKKRLYDDAFNSYMKTYNATVNGIDDYSESIKLFQSLSDKDKEKMLFLIKNAVWDTISDFLNWLDGGYFLLNQTKNIELKFEENEEKINGYLQDIWINIDEGMEKEDIEDLYK